MKTRLALLLTFTATLAAAGKLQTPDNIADDECTAAKQADELATQLAETVTTAVTTATDMLRHSAQLKLLALTSPADVSAAASAAAAVAAKAAAQCLNTVKKKKSAIDKAVKALHEISASAALSSILAELKLNDIAPAAAARFNTIANGPLSFSMTNSHGACMARAGQSKPEQTTSKAPPRTKDQLAIVTLAVQTAATESVENGALFICGSDSTTAFSGGQQCRNAATNIGIKGGKVLKTAIVKVSRQDAPPGHEYGAAALNNAVFPHTDTIKNQLADIAAGLDAARGLADSTSSSSWETWSQHKIENKILADVLKAVGKLEESKEDHPLTKTLAAMLYGSDGKKAENAIKTAHTNFKPGKPPIESADKKLDSITDPDELYKAETYYTIKKFAEEEEQKKKNQENPSCPTKTDKPDRTT
uniref:Variant surface glycoprotein 1387 n=1 Tax=Trypanosoma brucei TaxID=5691 RepID=M4SWA7_9TRYP|nr:variant surface glycoprotein 1387 [Trypanosoma brucei]